MQHVAGLAGVFLATSDDTANMPLIAQARELGCGFFAGAEQDIVDRHIKLCERERADAVIRVTCDSPIFDIESTSRLVSLYRKDRCDYGYVSNMTMIQGTLSELISYSALKETHKHYRGAAITQYIKEHPHEFKMGAIEIELDLCRPEYRLTIDEPADIEMIGKIYESLYRGKPLSLKDVYTWLDDNPDIARINARVGIKGCEVHSAEFTERPVYTIVPSGRKFIILDAQKRKVEPLDFLKKINDMFPSLRG
jgi:spore coat polysaccharide biosynthesis protein SpsF (cytidylyltransferase family)